MVDMLPPAVLGIELNPKLIGALFTDQVDDTVRLFCYFNNGETAQFEIPAAQNRENLMSFYATLKIDETCTCMIVPDVVMGRMYARHNDRHYLYTVFKSKAGTACALDTNIISAGWPVIWQMPGIEILQAASSGRKPSSIAIRTQVGETDATRMMSESRVFTQPTTKIHRPRRSLVPVYFTIAFLVLGAFAGGAIYYNFWANRKPVDPEPVFSQAAPVEPGEQNIFLLFDHRISGPYSAESIYQLTSAGMLPTQALWRPENGNEWKKLPELNSTKHQP